MSCLIRGTLCLQKAGMVVFSKEGAFLDPSGIAVKGYGVHLRVSDFDSESGPVAYDLIPTVREVSGSNILRIVWNTYAKGDVATSAQRLDDVITRCIQQEMIPLVSFNDLEGSEDPQVLQGLLSSWMQSEYLSVFRKHEQKMLLEVSGGWNGSVSGLWHDSYFDAITILRLTMVASVARW